MNGTKKRLLLVESDHLLHTMTIDAKPGATFEIPVTADWERHGLDFPSELVFVVRKQ